MIMSRVTNLLGPLKVSMWDIMSWESDDNGMDMVIFVGILLALGALGKIGAWKKGKMWCMLKETLLFPSFLGGSITFPEQYQFLYNNTHA